MDNMWDNLNMWVYGLVAALISGVIILVRKIFTNEKQIALLEQQLDNVSETLKELRDDVKNLLKAS